MPRFRRLRNLFALTVTTTVTIRRVRTYYTVNPGEEGWEDDDEGNGVGTSSNRTGRDEEDALARNLDRLALSSSSSRLSILDLPPELVEQILLEPPINLRDLAHYSLVCRTFRDLVHPYLWYQVRVDLLNIIGDGPGVAVLLSPAQARLVRRLMETDRLHPLVKRLCYNTRRIEDKDIANSTPWIDYLFPPGTSRPRKFKQIMAQEDWLSEPALLESLACTVFSPNDHLVMLLGAFTNLVELEINDEELAIPPVALQKVALPHLTVLSSPFLPTTYDLYPCIGDVFVMQRNPYPPSFDPSSPRLSPPRSRLRFSARSPAWRKIDPFAVDELDTYLSWLLPHVLDSLETLSVPYPRLFLTASTILTLQLSALTELHLVSSLDNLFAPTVLAYDLADLTPSLNTLRFRTTQHTHTRIPAPLPFSQTLFACLPPSLVRLELPYRAYRPASIADYLDSPRSRNLRFFDFQPTYSPEGPHDWHEERSWSADTAAEESEEVDEKARGILFTFLDV